MKFTELKSKISDNPAGCYYLYGEDEFLIEKSVKNFKNVIDKFPELNIAEDTFKSSTEVINKCNEYPFVCDYKLIINRNTALRAEDFSDYISNPMPSTILVMCALTKSDIWGNTTKPKLGDFTPVDCNRIEQKHLLNYIAATVKRSSGSISAPAANELILRCDSFMTKIAPELDKLIAYKSGGMITTEDVKAAVSADISYKAYDLSKAVMDGDKARALAILADMNIIGELSTVFSLIYKRYIQTLNVALAPETVCVSRLGISSGYYHVLKKTAATTSKTRLKRMIDNLHRADADIKSGKSDPYSAFELFILSS